MALENPRDLLEEVRQRLARHERIRLPLPHEGRVYVDRDLPFVAVYRTPPDRPDPGTSELITGQAAYLLASGDPTTQAWLPELVSAIEEVMRSGQVIACACVSSRRGRTARTAK